MSRLYSYTVATQTGGIMEDPTIKYERYDTIIAEPLNAHNEKRKQEWLK